MSVRIAQNVNAIIFAAGACVVLVGVAMAAVAWCVARRRRGGSWKESLVERTKRWWSGRFNKPSDDGPNVIEKRVLAPASSCSISPKSRESVVSFTSYTDYSSMAANSHPFPQNSQKPDPQHLHLSPSPLSLRRFSGPCSPNHLGAIDPSLYVKSATKRRSSLGAAIGLAEECDDDDDDDDYPANHLGRVRFSVQYSMESEKLTVVLHQARGLPSRNPGSANTCDPFFKLTLLPDTRSQCRSSFKKKTCNPKFEETFVFQVPVKDFDNRILKLTVCDVDRLRRHNVIGHVMYPMKTSGILLENGSKKITVQKDIENEDAAEMTLEYKGEILISLTFNERTERLNVGIYEGRSFKKVVESAPAGFYVKITLMKNNTPVKSKKSDVIRDDDLCPKFNQSFSFKQSSEGILGTACVVISVLQSISGHKDKMLGRVVIGSFMFARGKELEHWNLMLAKQQENIPCWHTLT